MIKWNLKKMSTALDFSALFKSTLGHRGNQVEPSAPSTGKSKQLAQMKKWSICLASFFQSFIIPK